MRGLIPAALILACSSAAAQDGGSASVRELSQGGMHFDALVLASNKGGQALSLEEQISAARSAWALGLVEQARSYWDDVLANRAFAGQERIRELLARAILELQEGRNDRARELAEQAAGALESSDLRAQFWLVVGESLRTQGIFGQALSYYQKAAEEGSEQTRSEALYLLGESQLRLGQMNDARYSFTAVTSNSRYAVKALRRLAEIDYTQRNFEGFLTWVSEGRQNFPGEFEDPWTGYAMVSSLSELGRNRLAREELERIRVRHSEKNSWYALALAAVEAKSLQVFVPAKSEVKVR